MRPGPALPVADAVPLRNSVLSTTSVPSQKFYMHRMRRIFRRNRRGASAVEFALVAPVFFLFVFGMIEYGRLVMVQQVLTNATREGARRAVLEGATNTAVINAVKSYLTTASINGDSPNVVIDISPNPELATPSQESITVTVSVPFNDVSWLPSPMFLNGRTMTARSVMRREALN